MVINDKFRLWLLQLLLIGSSSLQVSCSSNLCKDVFREGYASYRDPKAMSYNPDNNLCYLAGNQTTLSSAIINSLNHCSNSSRSKSQCYLVAMNSLYFGDSYDGNYCQEIDNEFINKPGHKAIAMGFGSGCYSVWSLLTPELAVQKALENCMNSGSTCTIYAIDDIMSNMRIANWGKKNRSTSDAQDKAMLTLLGGFLQGVAASQGQYIPNYGLIAASQPTPATRSYSSDTTTISPSSDDCKPTPSICVNANNRAEQLISSFASTNGIYDSASQNYCAYLVGIEVNSFCADAYRSDGRYYCADLLEKQVQQYQSALPQLQSTINASSITEIRRACAWERG